MTAAGIALGVSAAVAIGVVRDSLTGAFVSLVDAMAGDATVQVGGDGVPIPDTLLDDVRAVPGVRRATASIMLTARLVGKKDAAFLIAGVDVLDEQTLSAYKRDDAQGGDLDPIVFLNSRQSLLMTRTLAERNGFKEGDEIKALTPGGVSTFKLRGLIADTGPAKIFGGNYAIMYLDAAQALFHREGTFDRIDVITTDPVDPVLAQLRTTVGTRAAVERPQRRGARMEQFLASLDVGMVILSLVAVFVGMFLVYNTVSTSVAERRREIGILRALGMTRGSVLFLFAGEAAVLGALGGLVGIPAGIGLGRMAMLVMQHQVAMVLPIALDHVFTSPRTLGLAWLVGILASAFAALAPAARGATVKPRDAIEHGSIEAQMQSHPWAWAIAGVICLALAALCYVPALSHSTFFVYGAEITLVLGVVAMTPVLSMLLARVLGVIGGLSIHARLAVDHVRRARQVTTVTVSALAVGVCLAVASASVTRSFKISAERVLEQSLPADLFIHGGAREIGQTASLMDESMVQRTLATPGVAGASGVRLNPTFMFRDEPIALVAPDARTHLKYAKLVMRQGNREQAFAEVAAGTGVIVSENFGSHFNVKVGDTITIPSPTGALEQRVSAFYLDYLSPTGTIIMNRDVYKVRFRESLIDSVDVFLKPGANANEVRSAIAAKFADNEQLLILKNEEVRSDVMKMIDETFLLVYAQEAVAIIVAILGILHALSVSVLERTRELGTLRAQGLTRGELIRVVLIEAALIGLMGSLIGALFGAALAHQNVTVLIAQQTGWSFDFAFAWAAVLTVSGSCMLAALLAGFLPARRASRLPIAEALRFE